MPLQRRSLMRCPECNFAVVRVVNSTPDASGNYRTIHRMRCESCDHRWYAATPHPVVINYVTYYGPRENQRVAAVKVPAEAEQNVNSKISA